jgi:cytidyltransferase-like protein
MIKKLLMEGPVGHMWHPFDLDSVQNGKDLLSVFENEVIQYINEFTPSIKIDGINAPIRLITSSDGGREFAIDRMSQAPIDREGITADRLRERFEKAILQALDTDEEITVPLHKLVAMGIPMDKIQVGTNLTIVHKKKKKPVVVKGISSGHGFVNDGTVALNVLNGALRAKPSEMEQVLRILDMWNNPNICLNNDIVHEGSKESGQVNAVKYGEDFIAFHGLNEIYSPEGKKTRKTREVSLSSQQKQALTALVSIINETNTTEGFRALSPFDTVALKGEVDIDYTQALGEIVEIKLDSQTAVAKSIGDWLNDSKVVKPSYTEKYTYSDGKKRSYFSKANYIALIPDQGEQQFSVRELLSEEAHPEITDEIYYQFVSGAIFYHATRVLGRAVLKTLVNKSKVGNEALTSHEGVVMRSSAIFGVDNPIKITGDFIRDGMGSNLAQAMAKKPINESTEMDDATEGELGDEPEEQVQVTTTGSKTVAVMPGSFKPPHRGHLLMAEHLSNIADEVLIFVSAPKGSKRLLPFSGTEITYEKAIELWRLMLRGASGNITIVESSNPSSSPIMALAEIMQQPDERKAYQDFDFHPEEYSKFYLAMSEKEKDDPGSMARFGYYEQMENVEITLVPAFKHDPEYAQAISDVMTNSADIIQRISDDIEVKALELAKGLVSSRAAKKLPANPSIQDYIAALSKSNQKKVAKFMKSTPSGLDKENFSATDLRLLLDLKKVYNLPVDSLLKDFVGQNLEDYLRIIFGSGEVNESINVIQEMVRSILAEQLDEMSGVGAVSGAPMGGSKPLQGNRKDGEDDEEEVNEATFHPSELPQQPGLSTMTVRVIPSSRHKSDGISDAEYKKSVKNKFKIDSSYTNKRAPYYSEDDIITDLVEKVLHNIIRLN